MSEKAVLISIRPNWVEKIESGEKTIEVRKSRPKVETPFKVYIYMTMGGVPKVIHTKDFKAKSIYEVQPNTANGRVIGEFVCDRIDCFFARYDDHGIADLEPSRLIYGLGNANQENEYLYKCCLTHDELFNYIISSQGGYGYGWHISDLKIYDKPKELKEFTPICRVRKDLCEICCFHEEEFGGCCRSLTRPPQSWCYVEPLKENADD